MNPTFAVYVKLNPSTVNSCVRQGIKLKNSHFMGALLKESVHYQNNKHVCRQRFKPSNVKTTLNEEDGIEVYCFFVLIFPLNLRSLLLIIQ